MSPDEEKTTVEVPENEDDGAPKKGKSKIMLFGAIGLVVVVLAVAGVMFMGGSSDSAGTEDSHAEQATSDSHDSGHEKPKAKSGGHGKSGHSSGGAIVYAIDDIVVNPAGTGGSRFLSVSFGFELGTPELADDFEAREALVRDALITILSSKTVAQLTDVKQKEITRYQIKKRLEKLMASEDLKAVYYTDFVLQ